MLSFILTLNLLYCLVNRLNLPQERREELCKSLFDKVQGKVKEVRSHKGAFILAVTSFLEMFVYNTSLLLMFF